MSLQALSDQAIQASHPIALDSKVIARVLRGLHVQEHQRILQEMLGGSAAATPVFSEEQVQFLAPQITHALEAATERDTVAFLVNRSRPRPAGLDHAVVETTAGSLYAYGLSLYVTLSQYRYSTAQPSTDSSAHRHLPDSSGLSNHTVQFIPRAAQRPDTFLRPAAGALTGRVIAIDYQRLQHEAESETVAERTPPQTKQDAAPTHAPAPEAGAPETSSQARETLTQREAEIRTLKDLVIKKDLELESLRKELQSVQTQVDRQPTKPNGQKRKTIPPSKPPQIAP